MSPARIHISRRTAELALGVLTDHPSVRGPEMSRALSEIRGALCSLAGRAKNAEEKAALPKPNVKAEQRARKRTAKQEWNGVKAEVLARSGGVCELCTLRPVVDAHHAFGGKNRRSHQSVRSVIAVCRRCHDGIGGPETLEWALCQMGHFLRHGFAEEAAEMQRRIDLLNDRAALAVKAEEVGRG